MADDRGTPDEVVRPRGWQGRSALAGVGALVVLTVALVDVAAGFPRWHHVYGLLLAVALLWTGLSLGFRERVELGPERLRVVTTTLGAREVA